MAKATDIIGYTFDGDVWHPNHIDLNSKDDDGNSPQPIFQSDADDMGAYEKCGKCNEPIVDSDKNATHWFYR